MKEPTTANERFHRWGMTPVETAEDDEPDRSRGEYDCWVFHRYCRATLSLLVAINRSYLDRKYNYYKRFYGPEYASILLASPAFRVAQSIRGA
jgi:hypothetical protein